MFRRILVSLLLVAPSLLCWQTVPFDIDTAHADIFNCNSTVSGSGCCYVVCPQGDGTRFDDPSKCDAIVSVTVRDAVGHPVSSIPADDFWVIGCNYQLVLCGGGHAIDADSATNGDGKTTISGATAAGGCDVGLSVVVYGVVIEDSATCTYNVCLPYAVKSPDINGDLVVDIVDFSLFAVAYGPPPIYDACKDYNCDGAIGLVDFSIFAQHFLHGC